MGKKEKKADKRGKKQRGGRKHESLKIWEKYEKEGNKVGRKGRNCPRCGSGTFLAKHKDRLYCGKCEYTDFQGKASSPETAESDAQKKESSSGKEKRTENKL